LSKGSIDYKHPLGFYVGIWGSNVDDYVSKGNIEMDFYGGYGIELFPSLNLDASVIYYYYPGDGHDPRLSAGSELSGHRQCQLPGA